MLKQLLLAFCFICSAWGASLEWNASVVDEQHSAPTGYRIHRGTAPGVYDWSVDVGNVLQWPIPDDLYGEYYWSASAYNDSGSSGYSNEIYFTRDAPPVYVGAMSLRARKLQQEPIMATFGFSGSDTTYRAIDPNYIYLAGPFSPASDGTLTSISVRLRIDTAVSYTFGLYSDNGGYPDLLIAQSAGAVIGTGTGWYTLDVSAEILASKSYWFGIIHASGDTSRWFYTSGNNNLASQSQTYSAGDMTDDLSVSSYTDSGNRDYHVYGTYTEGGGASAVPVIMRSYRSRRN